MKRIITAGVLSLAVTVFFTGCSSLTGSMNVDYEAIQTSAMEEVVTDENGENRLGITDEEKEMPDYFQKNLAEKFQNLEGKAAFHIKDGHSKDTNDIEAFQIVGLKNDKTFVYGYVSRIEGAKPREVVHCGATYNYESEEFKVFHEKTYARSWEDENEEISDRQRDGEESFFIQVCDSTGDIFVYDNGHAYIYDGGDFSEKFHGDIETFVRRQFQDAYSVTVVNAVTDGQERIYLEVFVEKEAVAVPDDEETEAETEAIDLETIGQEVIRDESEELDAEAEGKVESRILVYEFQRIYANMHQDNTAYQKQKDYWIGMTRGKEYERAPNKTVDWNTARSRYPDSWGEAYLEEMGDIKVYQWKGEPSFMKDNGVTTFLPDPLSYKAFKDVKENWEMENLFIPLNNRYSDLYGKTKTFVKYNVQSITRTYTYVWYETEGEGEDAQEVKHTEERSQTIYGILNKRYVPLENAYVESYWVMNPQKAVALGKCVGNEIQCTGEDGRVRWIQPGGDLTDTPYQLAEDSEAGVFVQDGVVYNVEFGKTSMSVVRDANHGGSNSEERKVIRYGKLAGAYGQGTSVHDAILEKEFEEELTEADSVYGNDYYTEDQVLHAEIDLDRSLAQALCAKGEEGICELSDSDSSRGFLLTSQEKGLIFYSPLSEKSAVLESGAWFRSWKKENNFVSVGFLNKEGLYTSRDVAFARVYEYNLSELCNESMKKSLEDIAAMEAAEASRQAEEASRQAEESAQETTPQDETERDPLEKWNEQYRDKYSQTYPAG